MASAGSRSVVVWEWETNDIGLFVPYDELSSNLIERYFASGMLSVDLSQLGAKYSAWTVNLSSMKQHSTYYGRERKIKRKTYSGDSLISYGVVWEFMGDLDWQQFDVKTSAIIEDNYNDGGPSFDIEEFNSLPIAINLNSMTVRNKQTMSVKKIRRRMVQVPYIGGSVGPLPKSIKTQQMHLRGVKNKAVRKKKISTESSGKIIVWESETDFPGIFAPFSEIRSNFIETEHAAGRKIVHVTINPSSTVQINFASMKIKGNHFARERDVRRVLYSKDVPIANKISWEWLRDLDWQLFQVDTSVLIEDHYQKGSTTLDLQNTPLRIPNILSFTMMNQTNRIFRTVRPVRRRLMSICYIEENSPQQSSKRPVTQKHRKAERSDAKNANRALVDHGEIFEETLSDGMGDEAEIHELTGEESGSDNAEEDTGAKEVQKLPKVFKLRKVQINHQILKQFCTSCDSVEEDEECSICLSELRDPSETYGATSNNSVVQLNQCNHKFHECCLEQFYESGNKDGSMQCPICKSIHGTKKGNQPPGTMTVQRMSQSIPGHPGCGCIQITYNIQGGIQGPNHPNPGQPYHPNGFPRVAYLPDNTKGNKVLRLLQEAWNRKLIFTVGTSVTNGTQNAVVWNEIHHKTEAFSNSSGHGYPDPNYLDNVLSELKVQGIV